MVTPTKPKLYIYQTATTIITTWETPPELPVDPLKPREHEFRWRTDVLIHPNVDIYVGKSRLEKHYAHAAIDQNAMRALQDAGIPVATLRREKQVYVRQKKQVSPYVQLSLFGE